MLTYRDFIVGLRKLDIDRSRPVIVHAWLPAFGEVHGGADTVLGALMSSYHSIIMPAFTFGTMIIPEMGPIDNAMVYGSGQDTNKLAEIYEPYKPVDPQMGAVAEALRCHPKALRSSHPILSFTGLHAKEILEAQTIKEPFLPFRVMREQEGWVLLMGTDQTANTSIHYAEALAGRKQFTRWALTPSGVVSCPGFPGCPKGFEAITSQLTDVIRSVEVGESAIQAMPLPDLIEAACEMIKEDHKALLCDDEACMRCNTIRASMIEL